MFETLAIITTCFLSGPLDGECFISDEPLPCRESMDLIGELAKATRTDIMVQCDYVPAPETSERPKPRPEPAQPPKPRPEVK